MLERNCIGVDINPLANLISSTKVMHIDASVGHRLRLLLDQIGIGLSGAEQLSLLHKKIDDERIVSHYQENKWRLLDPWNQKWYQPNILEQLVYIYSWIEGIEDKKTKCIAQVAFSDILRKSSNASSKYPNVMLDKNKLNKIVPRKAFRDSLLTILESLCSLQSEIQANCSINILECSNISLNLPDDSVDAIVTHPPYIAAIPYAEYGCLSLNWLGYDSKDLDSKLTGGRRHSKKVVDRFCDDYKSFFCECSRVLKTGRKMFIMVGNPTSHGEIVPLDKLSLEFANSAGFHLIETVVRRGQNRRGNKMGEEYLFFFENLK